MRTMRRCAAVAFRSLLVGPARGLAGETQEPDSLLRRTEDVRDAVGDMNASAVTVGDFPGAIRIPGSDRVSIAIGGFVKTVAIGDSKLEGPGPSSCRR